MENDPAQFIAIAQDMESAMRQLELADIEEPAPQESPDEERKILRWLGNLPSATMPLEDWLEAAPPPEALARATSLSQLIQLFIRKLKRARKKNPKILHEDAAIEDAAHAAAAMTQAVAEHALFALPDNHPRIKSLEASIAGLPPQAEMRQSQSVKRLVETLETGFERVSGKNISGKSPPEKLAEMSRRIEVTARKLRSIDSLEPPAREESVELAREILRRLKNLGFSDKPVKEMIDAGRPEDKAALAQKIEEMADMYKNLVQEAAQINPNILQDKRIKDASDAVSTFSHAVQLMAAKEMPTSAAATQQISAAEGKQLDDLHQRMAERLESIERGLNAAKELLDQQQEQQQDDLAQEAAEAAAQHADHAHRRKKKRKKRGGGSATGAGKKQAKHIATSDAKVAKESAMVHLVHGLNAEALAAVKQLGGSLLGISNQAKEIGASLANVSSTDKIAPDDKTVSQRVIETELQKGPRNQGPGV